MQPQIAYSKIKDIKNHGEHKLGTIKAVCISEKKGTVKINVGRGKFIENFGIEGDAHAGNWHRQVSLLSYEKIEAFKQAGADLTDDGAPQADGCSAEYLIADGCFGENLIVEGIDLKNLPVGTILKCGEVLLEVTQIGKECHSGCQIAQTMGTCIMPTEGIFAKVKKGGVIEAGDIISEKQ